MEKRREYPQVVKIRVIYIFKTLFKSSYMTFHYYSEKGKKKHHYFDFLRIISNLGTS